MEKKRSVTAGQAKRISKTISLIVFFATLIITLKLGYLLLESPLLTTFVTLVFAFVIACLGENFVYEVIFNGTEKEDEEERQKANEQVRKLLSTEDYTEVFCDFSSLESDGDGELEKMVKTILQKEKISFFAKLGEKNEIELIVKDKRTEIVYITKITDYSFYLENFR